MFWTSNLCVKSVRFHTRSSNPQILLCQLTDWLAGWLGGSPGQVSYLKLPQEGVFPSGLPSSFLEDEEKTNVTYDDIKLWNQGEKTDIYNWSTCRFSPRAGFDLFCGKFFNKICLINGFTLVHQAPTAARKTLHRCLKVAFGHKKTARVTWWSIFKKKKIDFLKSVLFLDDSRTSSKILFIRFSKIKAASVISIQQTIGVPLLLALIWSANKNAMINIYILKLTII